MKLVNLCPHPIHILNDEGEVVTIPQEWSPARVSSTRKETTLETEYGGILLIQYADPSVRLPPELPGVVYIVSEIVANNALWLHGRRDFVVPVTRGRADSDHMPVRNDSGRLDYIRALRKL